MALCGATGFGCTITSNTPGAAGEGSGTMAGSSATTGGMTGTSGSGTMPAGGGSGGETVMTVTGMCSHTPTPAPTPPAEGMPKGPCDIYAADNGPCVAAHSTVRALYATYAGPLYQIKKADGTTQDIKPMAPGGLADSAAQDMFCGVDACTISIIYDQSGQNNHLTKSPAGEAKKTENNEARANAISATFGGHKVYGVHISQGVGYRDNNACGTATGDNAETEYMIVAGDVQNNACCFDYGNMERNSRDNGDGTMEAVYFGKCTIWNKGGGAGPWIMGDLENGLWAGDSSPYNANGPVTFPFITGMVKGDAAGKNHWAIKIGNATGGLLAKPFDGPRPGGARYQTMRKEGAIGLGTGGDNSSGATGNWFEGVMTAHYSSDAADDAVQASIVSVYGAM